MYHPSTETKPAYARILIMGEPGLGKTLLASTLEDTLILDLEGRAAHAGRPRFTFTKDRQGLTELQSVLKALAQLKPDATGALQYTLPSGQTIPVRAVQLDSLDELQLNIDMTLTTKGFDYWREMLEIARDIITLGRMVNAHFICVAHTKVYSSEEKNDFSEVNLALQGQFGQQVPRWFDVILNMLYDPRAQQSIIITQPTLIGRKLYYAKDALNLFKAKQMPVRFTDGRPEKAIMEGILAETVGGTVDAMASSPAALVERLEKNLAQATTFPIPANEFLVYCKAKGWDMGEGGDARAVLVAKFGPGYDAQKGQQYIDYLTAHYSDNQE